jgi:tRNA/tmRNA/rRNA uracil-C5-methylase (TrmA/RlmC/RlmD family)
VSHPLGTLIELEAGSVAHGGHVVARTAEGQVVFVRHALPGERVVAEVTETPTKKGGRFLRADAVEVLIPSPHRVPPPCPYSGPGRCGGCDFQHVELAEQRRLKATVVEEQLHRLAGIEREVTVEEVAPTLRWRSRMRYVDLGEGRRGLRKHRSREVVEVDDCLIDGTTEHDTLTEIVTTAHGTRTYGVAADGFWQPHVEAPRVLVEAVLELAQPRPGERVLDLYSGVGLFSAFLAEAVGPEGSVTAVEGDHPASRHSRRNLADLPWARTIGATVEEALRRGAGAADLVVLDPPRVGAKRVAVRAIAELGPRAVVYVACDPAALARDLGYFAEHGYRLDALRAFDLFPMTHHVECVALVVPQ